MEINLAQLPNPVIEEVVFYAASNDIIALIKVYERDLIQVIKNDGPGLFISNQFLDEILKCKDVVILERNTVDERYVPY